MKHTLTVLLIAMLMVSCADTSAKHTEELNALQTQIDSLKTELTKGSENQIATFLTFQNNDAEEAMNFYVSLFENSKVIDVQRYGKEGPAKEGTIMFATFELNGSSYACSDSPAKHEWDFTPGVSNFVTCKSDAEIENLFNKLSENGQVLMPLNNYGWSQKFAFIEDRFGVSWQLNLD